MMCLYKLVVNRTLTKISQLYGDRSIQQTAANNLEPSTKILRQSTPTELLLAGAAKGTRLFVVPHLPPCANGLAVNQCVQPGMSYRL
jgi:hypothetical protein